MADAPLKAPPKPNYWGLALVLLQFAGMVSLCFALVFLLLANMAANLTFGSNPLLATIIYGYPIVLIGSVPAAWILYKRKKLWAAVAISGLPPLFFVLTWGAIRMLLS